jgi:transaldolase
MDDPVQAQVVAALHDKFADFRRAYDEDGLSVAEFLSFGPTRRTLRQFLSATAELEWLVRDTVLPDPDAEQQRSG